jgi:hypothetical protein
MNERIKNLFELYGWKHNEDPDAALRRAMARVDAERFEFARKFNEARAKTSERGVEAEPGTGVIGGDNGVEGLGVVRKSCYRVGVLSEAVTPRTWPTIAEGW